MSSVESVAELDAVLKSKLLLLTERKGLGKRAIACILLACGGTTLKSIVSFLPLMLSVISGQWRKKNNALIKCTHTYH